MKMAETTINVPGEEFIFVEASKLSLGDSFMKNEPKSCLEQEFKELLIEVIKEGVHDFYRPKLDPSFDSDGNICYRAGLRPAIGKSYEWWEVHAKEFLPERKSRLGTKNEYVAFIGVLIKTLVENGWEVATAWNAVCYNSKNLGHYRNSEGALHDFEPTGSREICGFCDLANTMKLVANTEEPAEIFWIASHSFCSEGEKCPIADIVREGDGYASTFYKAYLQTQFYGVGWLVLEK